MPEEHPTTGATPQDAVALARAAIADLGPDVGLLLLAANGLDGHRRSSAPEIAQGLGYAPDQARVLVLQASATLATRHRSAFDALVRAQGPDRTREVANDPWYRFAVQITRGSLSRWAR